MDSSQPTPPYFDDSLGSWVLSRYADVATALREPRLSPPSTHADDRATNFFAHGTARGATHGTTRGAARERFSRDMLVAWQSRAEESALAAFAALSARRDQAANLSLDLLHDFAAPWSLSLAVELSGAEPADAALLSTLAHEIFMNAAHAKNAAHQEKTLASITTLAAVLSQYIDDASLAVQSFVALSQTLPHALAGSWLALIQHPDQQLALRARPALIPSAVEELLRHSGPSRAVFRDAHDDFVIDESRIAAGDRVTLLLAAANRDAARFPYPDRLDLDRDATGHLAFGRGTHSCVGASLIRVAIGAATRALLAATRAIELAGRVDWIDGFAIRAPSCLPVIAGMTIR